MEANWKEEFYFLEAFKKAVATQLHWGNSDQWRHSDFITLSEKIFEKTGVMLSSTTLKRIWGKLKYEGLPTPNTLNALAQYLGYENWLAFKNSVESDKAATHTNGYIPMQQEIAPLPKPKRMQRWASPRLLIGFACIGGLLLLLISFIVKKPKSELTPAQIAKVKFTCQPLADGVPNTVIFNYDLGDIISNDIQIQQSWDSTKRIRITEVTNEAASTYYLPGYWRAKLIINGQIVKEHDVFIKSQGWLVTQDFEPQPRYFLPKELIQNGYLGVDSLALEPTKNAEPVWLTYHYIEDFGDLYSNNFIFKASIKNTYHQGNGICQTSRILILCEHGFIGIPFSIPGCVGDLRLRIFDYVEDGDNRDLSAFGCDFSQWQRLRCEVQQGRARLYLNDQLIRDIPIRTDAGRVVGVKAGFLGAGVIDEVAFYDGKTGKVVYQNSFDPKSN